MLIRYIKQFILVVTVIFKKKKNQLINQFSFKIVRKKNMLHLKEGFEKQDSNKIISSLIKLRALSTYSEPKIDKKTFGILVELIKRPNTKIINYTLSILANCCLHNMYRILFKDLGGVSYLLMIVKTIDNDNIICRACRLIGNLASNNDLAKELCKKNAGLNLLELLKVQKNLSSDTLIMIHRAMKKLWLVREDKWEATAIDVWATLNQSLTSPDDEVVRLTLQDIIFCTKYMNEQKINNKLLINKELLLKLTELGQKEEFNKLVISCLSGLFTSCKTSQICIYLEGSNVAETFIEFFQRSDTIDNKIYSAFSILCIEAAIRAKIRLSGLLPKLIDLTNASNVLTSLHIFYLFQFDVESIRIFAQNAKFTSILINNIYEPRAVVVLEVLSRLDPPVKELVAEKNLDIIIKNKNCHQILKNITRTRQFLEPIILSGKVWEIEKAGCSMEDVGCLEQIEPQVIYYLENSNDKKRREEVSLAIPFLVKPRSFELLYKLLARCQVVNTILNLLEENPTQERVLASIVRLIKIFRSNYYKPEIFFQDLLGLEIYSSTKDSESVGSEKKMERTLNESEIFLQPSPINETNEDTVTFELDCGASINVNKSLLCKKSPVLNSMLNGYFLEARQKTIRLRECSLECLKLLMRILEGKNTRLREIDTEKHLELISVTDRFLLTDLNIFLAKSLDINKNSCFIIYNWYHRAGFTKENGLIGQKVYEYLFSSSENILSAMTNETCKTMLVKEITQYLSNSVRDLL